MAVNQTDENTYYFLEIYRDEAAFEAHRATPHLARWRQELYARGQLSTEDLITDFAQHLDGEAGSLAPKDDLTMIVIDVR